MSDPTTPIPSSEPKPDVLRVTLDDLQAVSGSEPVASVGAPAETASGTIYGTINDMPADPVLPEERASILLQGWFYLGLAGLLGALAGWGICEPWFVDGDGNKWGNIWLLPLLVTLMSAGFGVAESVVERSWRKGLIRFGLALPLGIVFGFLFNFVANLIYGIGLNLLAAAGVHSFHNPAAWIARGVAWAAFGVAGGVVYGIVGRSGKKAAYGALGGAVGALLGGCIFDPISFVSGHGSSASVSRATGFGLLGLATGVAMGLVESALKDRWLYVTAGPLAGKQFILYKPVTVLGSTQQTDIYLFKDAEILPAHATLALKGSKIHLTATGPVYVGGNPVRGTRVLDNGAVLRIGRYGFRYQEKQR